jgi:hypothetical protein
MNKQILIAAAIVSMAGCADLREISSHIPSSQNYWVTAGPAGNCGVDAISGKTLSAAYCKAIQDVADANAKQLNSDLDMYDSIAEQRALQNGYGPQH